MELHYAKVTSKGQVTIPAALRRRLEIEPGSTILFRMEADDSVAVNHPAHDIEKVFGSVALPSGVPIDRMNEMAEIIGTAEAVARDRQSMGEDVDVDECVRLAVERATSAVAR